MALHAQFHIPEGWISREEADRHFNADGSETAADEANGELPRAAFDRAMGFVDGLPGERDVWILPGKGGRIDALLTLRGRPVDQDDAAALLEDLASDVPPSDHIDLINRVVREVQLPSGPAVEAHDFSVGHGFEEGTRPASERATVTIFPPFGGWAVDLMLVTQDLLLFEDSLEYLHAIAETILPFSEAVQ